MKCQNPECGKLFRVAPWRIHLGHIDLRKVEKFYFIELLVHGGVH